MEVPGFEADDVMGTLAKHAEKEGFTTYMMTPDKDFGQLVTDKILQYKPAYKGGEFELRGVKEVCEKYGLQTPLQVIDLLALSGDKIDCIPGCPGVGEKTAVKLITQFGSIDNLLANTAEVKGALRKKIEENAEQIKFSEFLATIRTDVPTDITPQMLVCKEPDFDALSAIFDRLEFRTLKERVFNRLGKREDNPSQKSGGDIQPSLFDSLEPDAEALTSVTKSTIAQQEETICNTDELQKVKLLLEKAKTVGIHTTASGESDMTAKWESTAIAFDNGTIYNLPNTTQGATDLVLQLFENEQIEKCTYQAKRDFVLAYRAHESANPLRNYYDVAIADYLLKPEGKHTPEMIIPARLPEFSDTSSPGAIACSALQLKPLMDAKLQETGLTAMLHTMELPLTRVLAEMEIEGVQLDVKTLNLAAEKTAERIALLEEEIHTIAGEQFNVGSPAQTGEILFGKLALDPKAKRTKSGQFSTADDVLEKISHLHPIVGKIQKFRQLRKLLGTYLSALPQAVNPETGKVHTTYNQTITATGRISSSDPNLQNIPVRDDEGREIRRAFIPSPGNIFLSADYSQIELRLMADMSGDETMIDAFNRGSDIHAITASKIYHEALADVTPAQRRNAKTANFGIIYGISAFGLAQRLSIPRSEAKTLIDGYFNTFPGVRKYMDDAMQKARETGYVTTIHGRRRILPDINSRNPVVRSYAERNAINAPLQGSAADIIKIAMVGIADKMRDKGLKSKMIMQVHDELNFDVVPEELSEMQQLVTECMEKAYTGRVKLTVSVGVADNWLDAH